MLEQTKEDILNTADFDRAYEKYVAAYRNSGSGPILEETTDPKTYQEQQRVKKKLFVQSLTSAREHNKRYERGESSYKMAVNRFFTMNEEEKKRYLGLNGKQFSTIDQIHISPVTLVLRSKKETLPTSFHWNYEGYLVDIKDQESCGSCWAFVAVGLMEWASVKVTGQNITLSEQYILDCTYEKMKKRDGCNGGWYTEAWDYIIQGQQTGGVTHLVKQSDYAYEAKDNRCVNGAHTNALRNILRLTGYVHVAADLDSVLRAVAFKMPLAVAINAEDELYLLGKGIYDGCKKEADPNHAVILSGYGKKYFEIRNSWGTDWGVGGYGKLKRYGDMCSILSYAYYIEYEDIRSDKNDNKDQEEKDEKKDKPTEPPMFSSSSITHPTTEPLVVDTSLCVDYKTECGTWADEGHCEMYDAYMTAYCKKSCSKCRCADDKSYDCKKLRRRFKCTKRNFEDFNVLNVCPVTCRHCSKCPAGFFTHDLGCVQCPANHYSLEGSTECRSCPHGKTAPAGSKKRRDCKNSCPAGFIECDGSCKTRSQCH